MRTLVKGRWFVVILTLCACVAFAMSVQGGQWWVIGNAEVGPFGAKRCFEDGCTPTGLGWLGADERWMRIGMGTWAGGLISVFVLIVMAGAIAAKRIPKLAAKTALVAIATVTLAGMWFVVQFPRETHAAAELSRGAILFVVAIVLGVASAIWVLRGKPLS